MKTVVHVYNHRRAKRGTADADRAILVYKKSTGNWYFRRAGIIGTKWGPYDSKAAAAHAAMSQGYTVEPSTNEVEDSQFNSHRDWGKLRQKTSTVSDAKSGKQKDSELSEFLEQLSEALLSGEDKASVTRGDAGERSVEERLRVAKEQYEQNMRRATTYNERAEIKEDYEAFVKSLKATSDASKEEERQQLKRELENLRIKEMNASTSGKVDLVDRIMAVKQRIAELSKNTGDKHGTDCDCADCMKMRTKGDSIKHASDCDCADCKATRDKAATEKVIQKDSCQCTSTTDASPDEIEEYFSYLRGKSKEELIRMTGLYSRLDQSHLKSEPRESIINYVLSGKFSRKELDAWGKAYA